MTYTVYLSSTLNDLAAEREAVKKALSDECVVKHSYVASEKDLVMSCLDDVGRCDAYILVLGLRYGYVPEDKATNPQQLSITELEFQRAAHIPRLVFIKDENHIPFGLTDAKTKEHPPESIGRFRALAGDPTKARAARFESAEDLPLAVVKAFNAFKDERERQELARGVPRGETGESGQGLPCPVDQLPELRLLDRGDLVRLMQRALRRHVQRQLQAMDDDGVFGWVTELWVRLFQFRISETHQPTMRIDGLCGRQTWGWLAAFQPEGTVLPLPGRDAADPVPRLMLGTQGEDVRHLQRVLRAVNFSALPELPEDGIFDMATELQLRAFQLQLRLAFDPSLPADGVCTPRMWRWLVAPARSNPV